MPFPSIIARSLLAYGFAFLAAACVGDTSLTAPPTAMPPVTKPPAPGVLRIITDTRGEHLDPDGYLITGGDDLHRQMRTNDTVEVSGIAGLQNGFVLEISGIAPNCWMFRGDTRYQQPVPPGSSATLTFSVYCYEYGRQVYETALRGVWRLQKMELFMAPDFSDRQNDLVTEGISANLMLTDGLEAGLDWRWYATTQYGATSFQAGTAEITESLMQARNLTGSPGMICRGDCSDYPGDEDSYFDCWGDCDGPLHGSQNFAVRGDTLVISRPDSIDASYWSYGQKKQIGPFTAWSRLTFLRRR